MLEKIKGNVIENWRQALTKQSTQIEDQTQLAGTQRIIFGIYTKYSESGVINWAHTTLFNHRWQIFPLIFCMIRKSLKKIKLRIFGKKLALKFWVIKLLCCSMCKVSCFWLYFTIFFNYGSNKSKPFWTEVWYKCCQVWKLKSKWWQMSTIT